MNANICPICGDTHPFGRGNPHNQRPDMKENFRVNARVSARKKIQEIMKKYNYTWDDLFHVIIYHIEELQHNPKLSNPYSPFMHKKDELSQSPAFVVRKKDSGGWQIIRNL